MKKTRKGFTIVELIIVIAVIAVLTAILVPTFIHLTKKANEAADHSLVTNLNKALAMREAEEGDKGKNNTLHDAVEYLDKVGYRLPNLVTKSDDKLLWNQKTNRFLLESDDKGDYKAVDFWRIQDSIDKNQAYSVYAGLNFTVEKNTPVEVAVGFDAGYHTEFNKVVYKHSGTAQTVTIRTNGYDATLTVDAALDTVHHYNYLNELTVTAVEQNNSYHEHGIVKGKVSISAGHFVVEQGAEVPYVSVENATDDVKVTTNESTIITVDDSSASNTTIVANSKGVYVSGEVNVTGTKSNDVVRSDLITTWEDLVELEDDKDAFAKLGADITNAQTLTIDAGHKFKLDLNGHTLQTIESQTGRHYYAIDNYGESEIFDSKNGAGQIKARGLENLGEGKLTILSGKFYNIDTNGGAAFWNEANLTVNGGSFIVEYEGPIKNGGPTTLYSLPGSKLTINSGTFNSANNGAYAIIADGETLINSCNVFGSKGALAIDSGDAIINGGSFTSVNYYGCWITNDGTDTKVTINGGSFSGLYGLYSSVDDGHQDESNVAIVINGGSFTGQSGKAAIINAKQSKYRFALSVYGGTFNSDPTEYLAQGHTASQKDGIWTVK